MAQDFESSRSLWAFLSPPLPHRLLISLRRRHRFGWYKFQKKKKITKRNPRRRWNKRPWLAVELKIKIPVEGAVAYRSIFWKLERAMVVVCRGRKCGYGGGEGLVMVLIC